jgi:hypothetical protein
MFTWRAGGARERDTRKFTDFLLDDNVLDSADVLLSERRAEILGDVCIANPSTAPFQECRRIKDVPDTCWVWHLGFQGLLRHQGRGRQVFGVVNAIVLAHENPGRLEQVILEGLRTPVS